MPVLTLQTTPEMCQHALTAFTPMEQSMTLEAWMVADAAASHELLALVRVMAEKIQSADFAAALDAAVESGFVPDPWVQP